MSITTQSSSKPKRADAVRIGFITDLDGPYAHVDGRLGLEAVHMAIADHRADAGRDLELLTGDHLNDEKEAARLADKWFTEEGLDVLIGGVNSNSSLAMAKVAAAHQKPYLAVGSGSMAHTRAERSPFTIHYAYDTNSLAGILARPVVPRGGNRWFFLSADYPIGGQLMDAASDGIRKAGGEVVAFVQPPRGTEDFKPFLEQARQSGANVLGLTNTHYDMMATVRAARAMRLSDSMQIAAAFVFLPELHQVGLEAAQGMILSDSWYWDRDEDSRAWSRRFFLKTNMMPSSIQAANYSATALYLRGIRETGMTDGEAMLGWIRAQRISDMYMKEAWVRDDGRVIHDMYVYRVKAPEQSREAWDYYELLDVVAGEEAWR